MERRLSFNKYSRFQTTREASQPAPKAFNGPSVLFNDGKRRIDYVLVYCKKDVEADEAKTKMLSTFLKNVKLADLQVEEEQGLVLDALTCIKVHAPTPILKRFITAFKLELNMHNPNYKYHRKVPWKCMSSIVVCPDSDDPITRRAPETLSGKQPTDFTNAERIFIVKQILSNTKYDQKATDTGFEWLLSEGVLVGAYPLHDSPYAWTDEGPLTDRQLLSRYWASFRCFHKEQPLTIIERYYGPTIAFYFAWVEYYTVMLVPAAAIGLFCFLTGIIYYAYTASYIEKEVCNADQFLCPVCPNNAFCKHVPLKRACFLAKMELVMENPITILYSILMSFWGVMFMILWKRKQALFNMRWNLNKVMLESDVRPAFIKRAQVQRMSSITGSVEYYVKFSNRIVRRLFSCLVSFLMLCVYLVGVIIVVYYRTTFTYYGLISDNETFKEWYPLIEVTTSCSLGIVIMMIINVFRDWVARKLTQFENPRSQSEFDRHFTLKAAMMAFGNMFFPMFYLAFFKGRFYTHPGEPNEWKIPGIFQADVCKVSGCLIDLTMQLMFVMIVKHACFSMLEFMIPYLTRYKNYKHRFRDIPVCTQWEEDFVLVAPTGNHLFGEYIKLVQQYGFMILFLVAFPLAPIVALINNLIELRLDAIKILTTYRRAAMRKTAGIGEWNEMIKIITFFGTVSNPFLIAFSSGIISRYIYLFRNSFDLTGFVNSTLSGDFFAQFNVAEYPGKISSDGDLKVTTCYYSAKRNPPSHPSKYELSADYWYHFTNVLLLTTYLLSRLIPPIPRKVRLKQEQDERRLQQERLDTITFL
ncbi:hypothetical protein NQ315_011456 [Exocentrus adspersus]|uniref:Anoctamin n=1 Tax=Exocentrus adspersus TaxID=1586481 RepID=A0AAV8VUU9_9CUCU|nr:hypothetical protein NQ315_011456 [Exocentrus adspersus]